MILESTTNKRYFVYFYRSQSLSHFITHIKAMSRNATRKCDHHHIHTYVNLYRYIEKYFYTLPPISTNGKTFPQKLYSVLLILREIFMDKVFQLFCLHEKLLDW